MSSNKQKILVLDAHTSAGLACIRSFGSSNFEVYCASSRFLAHGFYSRYRKKALLYPDPEKNVDAFLNWLINCIQTYSFQVVFPLTEATLLPIADHRENLPRCASLTIPSQYAIEWTFNKEKTLTLASDCGLITPKNVCLENASDLSQHSFEFPVVVKEPATGILQEGKVSSGRGISYPHHQNALSEVVSERLKPGRKLLIQEFIAGKGVGLSFIMTKNGPLAPFAHKRLVEAHPTGSRAVLAESIPVPQDILKKSVLLLEKAEFYGPVMFEFKESAKGWILLEINGRFWGSLPLPISCGIDFPLLFYKYLFKQIDLKEKYSYSPKKRVHYLLGYAEHCLRTLKGKPSGWPTDFPSPFHAFKSFFHECLSGNQDYSFWPKDPLPALFEVLDRAFFVLKKLYQSG